MKKCQLKIKRVADFLISSVCIIVCSPFWLITVLAMKITMPGPVFFKQERIGKEFRPFMVLKFRTMKVDKSAEKNFAIEKDLERITPLGAFLRRSKIDETPQLLNIWKGTMSVIGPRPQLVRDVVFMSDEQRMRHTAKPGLTGLAQVMGRNAITWEEKLRWDLKYIENVSFIGDVKILLQTVAAVFKRSGITDGENATALDYGDALLKAGRVSKPKYDTEQAHAKILIKEHEGRR